MLVVNQVIIMFINHNRFVNSVAVPFHTRKKVIRYLKKAFCGRVVLI
jgi:hypothetical protein